MNIIFVGLGGFIGAVLRYLISLIPVSENFVFPIKTLFINILGAFVIGIITAIGVKNGNSNQYLTLFLKVGLCGGFTTFSTFALESYSLINSSNYFLALLYITLSVICSVLAVFFAGILIKWGFEYEKIC